MIGGTFKIERCFPIEQRSFLMIAGDVVDGLVRVGMVAEVRTTAGKEFLAIEATEIAQTTGRQAKLCLGFRYRDVNEMERWRAVLTPRSVIQFRDRDQPPPKQ